MLRQSHADKALLISDAARQNQAGCTCVKTLHARAKVHHKGLGLAIADLHAEVGRLQVKVGPVSIMHVCNTLQSWQKFPSKSAYSCSGA